MGSHIIFIRLLLEQGLLNWGRGTHVYVRKSIRRLDAKARESAAISVQRGTVVGTAGGTLAKRVSIRVKLQNAQGNIIAYVHKLSDCYWVDDTSVCNDCGWTEKMDDSCLNCRKTNLARPEFKIVEFKGDLLVEPNN